MSFGIIASPGTKLGPCIKSCEHVDCKMSKDMAKDICPLCNDQIGYETPFSKDPETGKWSHVSCLNRLYDKE